MGGVWHTKEQGRELGVRECGQQQRVPKSGVRRGCVLWMCGKGERGGREVRSLVRGG